jgi:hypothetical protein
MLSAAKHTVRGGLLIADPAAARAARMREGR